MNWFRRLKQFYYERLYPEAGRLGLIAQGLGIEARNQRYRGAWSSHLDHVRRLEEKFSALLLDGCKLMVLGAGRLNDFFPEVFLNKVASIRLIDGDPLCKASWTKFRQQYSNKLDITWRVEECSSSLLRLGEALGETFADSSLSFESALEKVRTLPAEIVGKVEPTWSKEQEFDAVVSLNLLSQIPLPWQDIVERELIRKFGKALVKEREAEWLEAYCVGAQLLIEQHLRCLNNQRARAVLLITDVDYCFYSSDRGEHGIIYSDGQWQVETEATKVEVVSALVGVEDEIGGALSAYQNVHTEEWIWNLVPGATGEIHLVRGAIYTLKAS